MNCTNDDQTQKGRTCQVFTDLDLKRLKECLPTLYDMISCPKAHHHGSLKALLARLEAAEACIDDHRGDCLADIGKACTCGYSENLEAWHNAKGDTGSNEPSAGRGE